MVKVTLTKDAYSPFIKSNLGNFYYIRIPLVENETIECVEDIVHNYPVELDFENLKIKYINQRIKEIILEIELYDKSADINSFIINGCNYWLDKATRVGLVNSINLEKETGYLNTEIWLNGNKFELTCDLALDILRQLEVYAKQCYSVTENHKKKVSKILDLQEIQEYDIKIGYPEKLNFTI